MAEKEEIKQLTPEEIEAAEKLQKELSEMSGTKRAAVLMLLLGEQQAAEIIRFLNPKEVQALGGAMVSVADLSQEAVNAVLDEFVTTIKKQTSLGLGTTDYVEKVLKRALGDDKAASVLGRIMPGQSSKGLDILSWMDARSIAEMIRGEHPQVSAIILSVLENSVAADVLAYLPQETRSEIIQRVASLEIVQPSAMEELEAIMKKQFSNNSSAQSSSFGGVKAAAKIMNFTKTELEASVMGGLAEIDPDLMLKIQDNMFTFDNLVGVDNRGPRPRRYPGADAQCRARHADDRPQGCQRRCQGQVLWQHVRTCPRHVPRRYGGQRPAAHCRRRGRPEIHHAHSPQAVGCR